MLPIHHIVCPTDFSNPSRKGVEAANALAEAFGSRLTLVNVVTPVYPVGAPGIPTTYKVSDYYEEMTRFAREHMDALAEEKIAGDLDLRKTVLQGNPAEEIVRLAESEHADVIVIATHGWTGWRRFVFGSVAEKVIRLAGCPVITIPGQKE